MPSNLIQVLVIVFPFLFVMTMIGVMSAAKKIKQVLRPRRALALIFLWLERNGLLERDEREQNEIVA
jgi:hypothetical protein